MLKTSSETAIRWQKGIEVFLIQGLLFGVLWGVYNREGSSYLVFAGIAAILALTLYSVIRHWTGIAAYGIQFHNLKAAFKKAVIPLFLTASICLTFAWWKGTGVMWPKWSRYIEYPLAGFLQQVIFQGFFFNRYQDAFKNRLLAIFLSALTFALFHLPNPGLMAVTFFTGLYAAYFFSKYRNIFVLALLHGWISLMLTMTLEPAGIIQSYKVGPLPMAPLKQEIRNHLTPETKIAQYMPSRGVAAGYQKAFDREVESFEIPHRLDSFLASTEPVFVAVDKLRFNEVQNQLKSPYYIWREYRVWLRKFPHRRSRTLKCVLTFNYSRLSKYYREDVLLISNRPRFEP